jgi:two-component system chemotaxis response regulator CheY
LETNCRVLVVENYPALSHMLRSILRDIGFREVDQASDGTAALATLRSDTYGLIFSDLNMEPMSGMQLLREVRADPKLKSLPFIVISGTGSSTQILDAKNGGASDYIVKPFTIDTVRKKIAGIVLCGPVNKFGTGALGS